LRRSVYDTKKNKQPELKFSKYSQCMFSPFYDPASHNGHSPMDTRVCAGVTAVAAGQSNGFILKNGLLIINK
jgi:hypothetical protein